MIEQEDFELEEDGIVLLVMSNDPTEHKLNTLETIYQSISMGQLAYADLKDADTGEVSPFLVGLDPVPGTSKFNVFPIAKLVEKEEDFKNYLVPDGAGNYYEHGNEHDISASGMPADIIAQLVSQLRSDGEEEAGQTEGHDEAKGSIH